MIGLATAIHLVITRIDSFYQMLQIATDYTKSVVALSLIIHSLTCPIEVFEQNVAGGLIFSGFSTIDMYYMY